MSARVLRCGVCGESHEYPDLFATSVQYVTCPRIGMQFVVVTGIVRSARITSDRASGTKRVNLRARHGDAQALYEFDTPEAGAPTFSSGDEFALCYVGDRCSAWQNFTIGRNYFLGPLQVLGPMQGGCLRQLGLALGLVAAVPVLARVVPIWLAWG